MYRESPTAARKRKEPPKSRFGVVITAIFLLGYFTFLPVLTMVVGHWAVYSFTMNNFYKAFWMMPVLTVVCTFLGGTLIRQKMEDEVGGMGLFLLAMVALTLFAGLTYWDIHCAGGIYSRFMPKLLRSSVLDVVWLLPGTGLLGMLFYKYFTVKHYS